MSKPESLAREMVACAAILMTGVVAIVAIFVASAWWMDRYDTPHAVAAPIGQPAACVSDVVVVMGDDPVTCNLTRPQRLDVMFVTRAECDDMGGWLIAFRCIDVDY